MTWESHYTTTFLAPAAFARSNPATKASYSASLLVGGKSRRIMHSILSPFEVWSTMLTPHAYLLEDPSVWMLHCVISSTPWPSMRVNLVMKSAITCPFIAMRGRYYISNSPNSTTHNAIRPAALGLPIAFLRGLSVRLIIICAWKYGLRFHTAVTNAKVSFSIWGYLSSAHWNAQLIK